MCSAGRAAFPQHVAPPHEHGAEHDGQPDHEERRSCRNAPRGRCRARSARRRARRPAATGSGRPDGRAASARNWRTGTVARVGVHEAVPSNRRSCAASSPNRALQQGPASRFRSAPAWRRHAARRWRARRCGRVLQRAEECVGQRDGVDVRGIWDRWRAPDRPRS